MKNNITNIAISVVITLVIVGGYALLFGGGASNFGSGSDTILNNDWIWKTYAGGTGTVQIGTNGDTVNRLNTGTCYIRPYAATISATSTVKVDCQGTKAWNAVAAPSTSALTGVTTDDNVVVTLATSTAGTTSGGLHISGASASSTAGYIEMYITNLTGATYTWPITTGIASGTAYYTVTN